MRFANRIFIYILYLGKKYNPTINIDKLVLELCKGFENTYRHLFTDNFYTSVTLFKELIELGIKATGTIEKIENFFLKT